MLSIVPTPLGNLNDMPPRALEALRAADEIWCEDTRRTLGLLAHFCVRAPVLRYNEHAPKDVERMLDRLRAGKRLALVSDGGMPVISDPGWRIVRAARDAGLPVEVLPGPSAVVAAVAGSGLPGDSFVFLGFLPRSRGRQRRVLTESAALGRTLVIYESPFRVRALLEVLGEAVGPAARCAVVRELSKLFEEWACGTVEEVAARLALKEPQGEYVVVVHPGAPEKKEEDEG